ncbi:GNAT family N-acetyltransferase [Halobacillus litoralis]|uniref:GNAT family N-acetyltransferase n=1 Tax=Halobacillus litoralis TaxID=45668 RepID=UPI001CD33E8E|nr:GNAT family N-acetyltransferase [Halobacillus litoralis]MCA0969326.1 GNAT family N-acetyltransferase [Halobacillus litoralis]
MKGATERLRWRPYTNADKPLLFGLLTDPDVMRYIGKGTVKSEEEQETFLQWVYKTYEKGETYGLHVVETHEGVFVGHAGIVPQTIEGERLMEIGYWIAPAHWGKGYATEVAASLTEVAFQELELNEVISLIQPGNKASIRVAEKNGMKLWQTIRLDNRRVHLYKKKI